MATDLTLGVRRPAEKFMGMAEEVPKPALAAPTTVAPTANRLTAAAVPAAAAAAPVVGGRAYGIGTKVGALAGRAAPFLGKALGGTVATAPLTGFGDYKLASDEVNDAADTFNAKGAVEAGLDSMHGIAKTGDFVAGLVGAKPGLAESFNKMVTNDLGSQLATRPKLASEMLTAGNPVQRTLQTGVGAPIAPSNVQTGAEPEKLAGTPFESFAGVRKVMGADGVPMYTNATTNEADQRFLASARPGSISGVSSFDPAAAQRVGDLQSQISLMRAGLADRGDINAYTDKASQQPGGLSSDLNARLRRMVSSGQRLSGTAWNAINQAAGAEQQAATQMRGQDLEAGGRAATGKNAVALARMKQMQDDREFGLKERQFGLDQRRVNLQDTEAGARRDSEAFTQQQTATKNLTDRYASQFRLPDGKVDDARVAKFTTGVQTFLGNKQAELAGKIATGKATPQEVAMLKNIQTKGIAALDNEDLTNIEQNIKRGERVEQTAGLTGGTFVQSNDPNAYGVKGRKQNLIGSDTIELNNGSTVRENDLRYTDPGNVLLPNIFKTKTDAYGVKGKKQ